MAEKILMIALSPTMEEGTISNWVKQEGDEVSSGDVLCEVETDKATMDYEAVQEGTLLKILKGEGESAQVEAPIAIIGEKGEDIEALIQEIESQSGGDTKEAGEKPAAKKQPGPPKPSAAGGEESPITAEGPEGRIKASPLARRLAEKYDLDLTAVRGSGPEGRIVKKDIEKAKEKGAEATEAPTGKAAAAMADFGGAQLPGKDRRTPVSRKRRIIAERLSESKYSAPHYYLRISAQVDTLVALRKEVNSRREGKLSFNAFLLKLAAEAIKRYPQINSSWEGQEIVTFGSIDIGLAVAQPDGLITPVVKNCGNKGITAIDNELKELIEKARNNKLTPDEYNGASFSISNLGSAGIEEFTAIINPPGSAILAVGAIQALPVFDAEGAVVSQQTMKFTLSCDHRVIDGAIGAEFLNYFKELLEQPGKALL
jgi:pyruvate dehydrogenase E2 component (dihydrolipoamide acetyltransferase)